MVKPPLRKTEKSPSTLILTIDMMIISIFLISCFVFPKFDNDNLKLSIYICFGISMFCLTVAWLLDPGFVKKDKDLDFMELLE